MTTRKETGFKFADGRNIFVGDIVRLADNKEVVALGSLEGRLIHSEGIAPTGDVTAFVRHPEHAPEHAFYPDGTPFPPQWCLMPKEHITTYIVALRTPTVGRADVLECYVKEMGTPLHVGIVHRTYIVANPQKKD